jgi:hypothetical protein
VTKNLAFDAAEKNTRRKPWLLLPQNGNCENTAHARRPKQKHGNKNHRKFALRSMFYQHERNEVSARHNSPRRLAARGVTRSSTLSTKKGAYSRRPPNHTETRASRPKMSLLSIAREEYLCTWRRAAPHYALPKSVRGERTWRAYVASVARHVRETRTRATYAPPFKSTNVRKKLNVRHQKVFLFLLRKRAHETGHPKRSRK